MIAKLIGRPDAALTSFAVNSVGKPEALGFLGISSHVIRVAQEPRGHARPQRENDERDEVAHGHGPTTSFVQRRPRDGIVDAKPSVRYASLTSGRQVEQDYEEANGAGDVYERVHPVDPVEQSWTCKEPFLERELPKDAEALLPADDLKGMFACNVDGTLYDRQGCDGAPELVHPVDEGPIPGLGQEGKLAEHAAQKPILEDGGVRSRDIGAVAERLEFAAAAAGCELVRCKHRGGAGAPAFGGRSWLGAEEVSVVAPLAMEITGPSRTVVSKVIALIPVQPSPAEEQDNNYQWLEEGAYCHALYQEEKPIVC